MVSIPLQHQTYSNCRQPGLVSQQALLHHWPALPSVKLKSLNIGGSQRVVASAIPTQTPQACIICLVYASHCTPRNAMLILYTSFRENFERVPRYCLVPPMPSIDNLLFGKSEDGSSCRRCPSVYKITCRVPSHDYSTVMTS
jgi:hypothetical protein